MTSLLWLLPVCLVAVVVLCVAIGWALSGPSGDSSGWSLGPDASRMAGTIVIALGLLVAGFVGVGNHRLPTVLSGTAPFAWGPALATLAVSLLVGGALLLAGRGGESA